MATPRLILGAGASQWIISANKASTTYGGAARADMSLWVPSNWSRLDTTHQTVIVLMVEIDAADADTLKSRYEELSAVVRDTNRDFVLEYDTGSSWLDMKTTDRTYANVNGQIDTVALSTVKAQLALTFTGERAVLAAGTGSGGTVENPTGLQDAIQYRADFDAVGTLVELEATGTFIGSDSADSYDRAATWRALWESTLPSWLEAATTLKDVGATFDWDSTGNECTCVLRFRAEVTDAPEVDDKVTIQRYSATIAPHTLGHASDGQPAGGAGSILNIEGELALRGDDQSAFGGLAVFGTGGVDTLVEQVKKLIEHGKRKANASGAQTLQPLSIEIRDGGWAARFAYSALINTNVIMWDETVTEVRPSPATIMRASDGTDRVYMPEGGEQRRISVSWAGSVLEGAAGSMPTPFVPSGDFVKVNSTTTRPKFQTIKGGGDDNDLSDAVVRVQTGTAEYLMISSGGVGQALGDLASDLGNLIG